jgi:hypothetical protein
MKNKSKLLIAIAGAILLVIAIAIPVFAAGPLGGNTEQNSNGQSGYGNCMGLGIGNIETSDNITALLGLAGEEIRDQRQSGKSLAQIAGEMGIEKEELVNAIMIERQNAIQEMVAAGKLSQDIANQRLEQIRERVQEAVNRTSIGPQSWSGNVGNGRRGGAGMMGQGNRSGGNQANCTGTPGTCTESGNMMRGGWNKK